MKKAVLIHGFGGTPMHGWRPWLKVELEAQGWEVLVPAMPDPDRPDAAKWAAAIGSAVGRAGKECYLVGHSLGCIAILRYLEANDAKIGGAVLVAGFAEPLGSEFSALYGFVKKPLDFGLVKKRCNKIVAIFSDNDPYVPLSQERLFREKLGAKTIVLRARGHFSSSEGCTKLPEALSALLEISR